ncbi:MAG: EamA family transporter [Arcobacter sp.]|nr:EamA family transporter [Arcobacter sp.]
MTKTTQGFIFATLAALFNSSVGIFSVFSFKLGLSPFGVAFFKCLFSLLILGLFLIFAKKVKDVFAYLKSKWKALAIISFFGVFTLYNFETMAYTSINVAVVVFCLFASSTMMTFALSAYLDKRFLSKIEMITVILSIIGLVLIFLDGQAQTQSNLGVFYAILSGFGYGVFLTLSKRFGINSSVITIFCLLLFGTIYLSFPYFISGVEVVNISTVPYILLLAIIPTIGGFFCTIKALNSLKSQSVQLIELSEPIFAICFGFLFLGQTSTISQLIGGAIIIFAIILHEFAPLFIKKKN